MCQVSVCFDSQVILECRCVKHLPPYVISETPPLNKAQTSQSYSTYILDFVHPKIFCEQIIHQTPSEKLSSFAWRFLVRCTWNPWLPSNMNWRMYLSPRHPSSCAIHVPHMAVWAFSGEEWGTEVLTLRVKLQSWPLPPLESCSASNACFRLHLLWDGDARACLCGAVETKQQFRTRDRRSHHLSRSYCFEDKRDHLKP